MPEKYTPEQAAKIRARIAAATKSAHIRRHPAEVTSDRLGDALTKWGDQFTGEEHDMVGLIRNRLEQIATGSESED